MDKNCIFFIAVAFIGIHSVSAGILNPAFLFEDEEVNCTAPGPICNGCGESWICIPVGPELVAEKLQDCPAGQSCVEQTGQCSSDFNPKCDLDGYEFVCHQMGMFPDPYRCNMYHMCCPSENGFTESTHECPDGYQYNLMSTLCDKELEPDCDMLVEACNSPGQTGGIPGQESMYYICMFSPNNKLYAQLYICPSGQVWINNKCDKPTTTTTSTTTSTTTEETTTDPAKEDPSKFFIGF